MERELIGYATTTRTLRNIEALRSNRWRLILTPDISADHGMPFALDNGAWGAFQRGETWDADRFTELVTEFGSAADWIVVPDIVCGGLESLRFTASWIPKLEGVAPLLIALQNGFVEDDVADWLGPDCGLFLGGDTEWKEATMPYWGEVAARHNCYYHVGRVNTRRRIRLCHLAGADSFDGTSVTRYAKNITHLDAERRQLTLWKK